MKRQIIPAARIVQSVHFLRGQKGMRSQDLASLYGVTVGALTQAVKRNVDRFPKDFVDQVTAEEFTSWGGARSRPFAFPEQGVAMLSRVLKSDRAVKVNIAIMRAFVKLRETIEPNRELAGKFDELERRVGKHGKEIDAIIGAIRQLMAPPEKPRREIGFHVREKALRYRTRNHR